VRFSASHFQAQASTKFYKHTPSPGLFLTLGFLQAPSKSHILRELDGVFPVKNRYKSNRNAIAFATLIL